MKARITRIALALSTLATLVMAGGAHWRVH